MAVITRANGISETFPLVYGRIQQQAASHGWHKRSPRRGCTRVQLPAKRPDRDSRTGGGLLVAVGKTFCIQARWSRSGLLTPRLFKHRSPAGALSPHLPRSCPHARSLPPSVSRMRSCSGSPLSAPRPPPVAAQPSIHGRVSRVLVPPLGSDFSFCSMFLLFYLCVLFLGSLSAPKSRGDWGFWGGFRIDSVAIDHRVVDSGAYMCGFGGERVMPPERVAEQRSV
jgi:hypothetical protein